MEKQAWTGKTALDGNVWTEDRTEVETTSGSAQRSTLEHFYTPAVSHDITHVPNTHQTHYMNITETQSHRVGPRWTNTRVCPVTNLKRLFTKWISARLPLFDGRARDSTGQNLHGMNGDSFPRIRIK